jgi:hypothetical protein
MTAATANRIIYLERTSIVLFDEDYKNHIAKLDAMLLRERHEVWKLREEIYRLKNDSRKMTTIG